MDIYNNIVEGETENFKRAIEINKIKIDDLLDPFKGHRAIHEAVLFDNLELVKFLIKNDAHLMARDYNGITPLIKAVSLNRINIVRIFLKKFLNSFKVKALIEAGVPLNHKDRKGRSLIDIAKLYNNRISLDYLLSLDPNTNSEKEKVWKKKLFKEKYKLNTWLLTQF